MCTRYEPTVIPAAGEETVQKGAVGTDPVFLVNADHLFSGADRRGNPLELMRGALGMPERQHVWVFQCLGDSPAAPTWAIVADNSGEFLPVEIG